MQNQEKQIEEMREKIRTEISKAVEGGLVTWTEFADWLTEALYNADYRKQEWISVDERLPEPNKLVLCIWEREDDGWNYGFARYQRENVWYVSNEGMPRVTHWMPLPEAPKMKGGAE